MRSTAIVHVTRHDCPDVGCGIGRMAQPGHSYYSAHCRDCGEHKHSHVRAELEGVGGWVQHHRQTCPQRPGVLR